MRENHRHFFVCEISRYSKVAKKITVRTQKSAKKFSANFDQFGPFLGGSVSQTISQENFTATFCLKLIQSDFTVFHQVPGIWVPGIYFCGNTHFFKNNGQKWEGP
jgi:hypothetical protein